MVAPRATEASSRPRRSPAPASCTGWRSPCSARRAAAATWGRPSGTSGTGPSIVDSLASAGALPTGSVLVVLTVWLPPVRIGSMCEDPGLRLPPNGEAGEPRSHAFPLPPHHRAPENPARGADPATLAD